MHFDHTHNARVIPNNALQVKSRKGLEDTYHAEYMGIADDYQQCLSSCDGDIKSLWIGEKTKGVTLVKGYIRRTRTNLQ